MSQNRKALEELLRKEIQNSGFPLENYCSIVLSKNGWGVTPHFMYLSTESRSEADFREIDIFAVKRTKTGVLNTLIIECKKQENKPWVLFEGNRQNVNVHTLNVGDPQLYEELSTEFKNHYYYEKIPCVYHFPRFEKKNEPEVILQAINKILDAVASHVNRERTILSKLTTFEPELRRQIRRVFYPVIVLDGMLYKAHLDEDGTITLTDSDYLQLLVIRALRYADETIPNAGIEAFRRRYIIDIVKKEHFEDFLHNF